MGRGQRTRRGGGAGVDASRRRDRLGGLIGSEAVTTSSSPASMPSASRTTCAKSSRLRRLHSRYRSASSGATRSSAPSTSTYGLPKAWGGSSRATAQHSGGGSTRRRSYRTTGRPRRRRSPGRETCSTCSRRARPRPGASSAPPPPTRSAATHRTGCRESSPRRAVSCPGASLLRRHEYHFGLPTAPFQAGWLTTPTTPRSSSTASTPT